MYPTTDEEEIMMRTLSKRLAALLVALAMTLTGLGAAAEAALVPQTPEAVFARGNFIKSEMHMQVDPQALSGLLGLLGAGTDPNTEQVMTIVNQVLSAINKLKATVIAGKDAMSMTAGTELAQIMDMQVSMKEGAQAITTNLLPGFKLTLPQDPKLQQAQSLVERHKKAFQDMQFDKLAAPYADALNNFIMQTAAPKATLLPGPVEIADVGSFDTAMTFDIDSHMMAGLLEAMVSVLKQDTVVRQLLDSHLKVAKDYPAIMQQGAAAADMAGGATPKDSAEMIAKLEEGITTLKGKPAKLIAHLGLYTNTTNSAFYATTVDKDSTGMLTVAYLPLDKGHDLKISFLAKQDAPGYAAPAATATQAPAATVDWAAVKAGVLAGTDFSSILLTLDMKTVPDMTLNRQNTDFSMKMYVQGMQIGIQATGSNALAAPYASKAEMSLTFMSPTPLITFFYEDKEVSDAPTLPNETGLKVVELNEKALVPEGELMLTLQQTALPALVENLKKALPEESAILLAFIQQLTSQSTPTPN
jgi:hypothetical protein